MNEDQSKQEQASRKFCIDDLDGIEIKGEGDDKGDDKKEPLPKKPDDNAKLQALGKEFVKELLSQWNKEYRENTKIEMESLNPPAPGAYIYDPVV